MSEDFASLRIRIESLEAVTAEKRLDRLAHQSKKTEHATGGLRRAFGLLAVAASSLAGVMSVRKIAQAADAFNQMQAQLKLVTDTTEGAVAAYEDLRDVANDTRAGMESTVELYTRLARSTEQMNLSHEQLLTVTTAINQAFKVSGASATESSNAIRQLAQGLAAGALRGDEFNSVMEQAPRLAKAIADEMRVTVGELRGLAAEGKLTGEIVAGALHNQAEEIKREFSVLPMTVGDAMTQLQNDVADMFGRTDTQPLVDAIQDIRDLVNDPAFRENMVTLGTAIAKSFGMAAEGLSEFVSLGEKIGRGAAQLAGYSNAVDDLKNEISELESKLGSNVISRTGLFKIDGEFQFHLTDEEIQAEIDRKRSELEKLLKASGFSLDDDNPEPVETATQNIKINTNLTGGGEDDSKAKEALQKRIDALKLESETLGMSAREYEVYTAKLAGANDAQLAVMDSAYDLIEAFKKDKDGKEQLGNLTESLRSEEEALTESYQRRRDIILANTTNNSELQKELLAKLKSEFSDSILFDGGFTFDIDLKLDELREQLETRKNLILENAELTQTEKNALTEELELQHHKRMSDMQASHDELMLEMNGTFWERWLAAAEESLLSMDEMAARTLENFSNGFGDAFESMIFDSQSLEDAFYNLMEGIARSSVNAIGQMIGQWMAYQLVQASSRKTAAAGAAASLTAEGQAASLLAGIHAFKSTAAIPVTGPPAAPAAMAAALSVTQPMAAGVGTLSAGIVGMAHDGIDSIPKEGTWLLDEGERVLGKRTNEDLKHFLKQSERQKQMDENVIEMKRSDKREQAATQPPPVVNTKIVNVMDKSLIEDYLGTDDGESAILNVMRNNPEIVRGLAS